VDRIFEQRQVSEQCRPERPSKNSTLNLYMDCTDERDGETPEFRFLMTRVSEALRLAAECSSSTEILDEDDFGFMAIHFLYKQMDHAESVQILAPRRDCSLVARTMIDGLSLSCSGLTRRPRSELDDGVHFSIINGWRLIQEQLAMGLDADESAKRRTEAGLNEFGDIHRTKKAASSSQDPFHKTWHGSTRLPEMASLVGRDLYDYVYTDLSDWEHWGVRGIGDAISRNGNHILFTSHSERIACQSLAIAFQCVIQVVELIDHHLKLGKVKAINSLSNDFISGMAIFRPNSAPATP
jgi:hypothetical protein